MNRNTSLTRGIARIDPAPGNPTWGSAGFQPAGSRRFRRKSLAGPTPYLPVQALTVLCLLLSAHLPVQAALAAGAPSPEPPESTGSWLEPITLTPQKTQRPGAGKIIVASSAASIAQASQTDGRPSVLAPGTITGSVQSFGDDRPLPDARIVAEKEGEEHKRIEVGTDDNGAFSLTDLEPGNWTLTISAPDMLSERRNVTVAAGESKDVKVVLEDLESVDVLRITGKRTLIHPEKIGSTTNIDHAYIYEYKSGNEMRPLIFSTPGVMPDTFGNIIVRGEHNTINYEMDGVILPEAADVLQQTQFATPRSLQSMQVEIGGYQAQDGGGPLGAIVKMKSLPIDPKPTLEVGGQIGGPLAGNIYFYTSGAASENANSKLHRLRFEASGASYATSYGTNPPFKDYVRNGQLQLNYLGKVEYLHSEQDRFKLTALINERFSQMPTSGTSKAFGVRQNQHDRQDMLIATWNHKFRKWFDESNLSIINAFYSQRFHARNAFDPLPIINGEEGTANSVAPIAKRFNYVFSAQGDLSKIVSRTHKLKAGFYSDVRPVRTQFAGLYYNANLLATRQAQIEAQQEKQELLGQAQENADAARQGAFDAAIDGGQTPQQAFNAGQAAFDQVFAEGLAEANAINLNPLPYAASISPFTFEPGGPLFTGNIGKYKGFRYLQSAFFQDQWRPTTGVLKRLTLDAGVRVDVMHSVFGDTLKVAEVLATIPDVGPFLLDPFQKQKITDAQASGRFGGAFVVTKNTVVRGSFSNIFEPTPVDVFVTAPVVEEGSVNGIFNGTIRPLRATRGHLVDVSIEQQVGPRFVTRTNFYYKKLKNFGDSGVVPNTPLYNRVTLSNLESYGVETRMDLKPSREGYGFYGFLSSSVQYARLRGCKCVTGGIYEFEEDPVTINYPDHDRRYSLATALGYKMRNNLWLLASLNFYTGVPNRLPVQIFGAHPARTPPVTDLGINAGWELPKRLREKHRYLPVSVDVRIDNVLNQRLPLNLGSPFQGTRYALPIRVLAGAQWKV